MEFCLVPIGLWWSVAHACEEEMDKCYRIEVGACRVMHTREIAHRPCLLTSTPSRLITSFYKASPLLPVWMPFTSIAQHIPTRITPTSSLCEVAFASFLLLRTLFAFHTLLNPLVWPLNPGISLKQPHPPHMYHPITLSYCTPPPFPAKP